VRFTFYAAILVLSVFGGLSHVQAKDIHATAECMSKPLQVKIFYVLRDDPTKEEGRINTWLKSVGEMYLVQTLQTPADIGVVITFVYRRCN
jgi:hypothetical protein